MQWPTRRSFLHQRSRLPLPSFLSPSILRKSQTHFLSLKWFPHTQFSIHRIRNSPFFLLIPRRQKNPMFSFKDKVTDQISRLFSSDDSPPPPSQSPPLDPPQVISCYLPTSHESNLELDMIYLFC